MELIKQFLKSKGFTDSTIRTYTSILSDVFKKIGRNFIEEQAENYLTYSNLSPRSYNLYRTVINFYTSKYLKYSLRFNKAKIPKSLPTYISKEEFNKILSVIPNAKHKLGLALMYGSGLRCYEVCRLKRHNIDYGNLIINIKQGKGNKDRQTIIHPKVIAVLGRFAEKVEQQNKSNPYLFQTYRGHISERSFQAVLKKALLKSGILKEITLHDLRHNFAINLVNRGIDIEEVRKMLGHSSLRTTQIYLQCKTSNLKEIALSLERNIQQ